MSTLTHARVTHIDHPEYGEGTVAGPAPGYEDEVLVRWDNLDGLSFEYPEQLALAGEDGGPHGGHARA